MEAITSKTGLAIPAIIVVKSKQMEKIEQNLNAGVWQGFHFPPGQSHLRMARHLVASFTEVGSSLEREPLRFRSSCNMFFRNQFVLSGPLLRV